MPVLIEEHLAPQGFTYSPIDVRPGEVVEVQVVASDPLDMFFMDQADFARFQQGEEFGYFGQRGTNQFEGEFSPPHRAVWYLVVYNPTDQFARVSVDHRVR